MKILKAQLSALAAPFSSGDTSFSLTSLKDSKGNAITLSEFGTWIVFVLKSGTTTEMVKCSAIVNNSDGTSTITVASNGRDLDPFYPYTGGATGQDFPAGADVLITNDPYTMGKFINVEEDAAPAGKFTFAQVPSSSAAPVAATDLVTLSYVQALVLGTLTTIDVIIPGTAGATIAAGNVVYLDTATGKWKLASAAASATSEEVLLGIAQGAGTDGVAIANGVLLQGSDANQTGMSTGVIQYLSDTPGALSSTHGTKTVTLGIAKDATHIYFAPRFNQQLTQDELDALAGDSGTPSSTNKFVTQKGMQNRTETYAASTGSANAYVLTLSPAIAALAAGQEFEFKANFTNTGAATLAVSGLTATAIKKVDGATDLLAGDIVSGQLVKVKHDGTNFQMISPSGIAPALVSVFKVGTATRTGTTASGSQTIAHGLGRTPKKVRITAAYAGAFAANVPATIGSIGTFDGVNTATLVSQFSDTNGQTAANSLDTSNIVYLDFVGTGGGHSIQSATIAIDATNITLTWTYNSSGGMSGNMLLMWEAEA